MKTTENDIKKVLFTFEGGNLLFPLLSPPPFYSNTNDDDDDDEDEDGDDDDDDDKVINYKDKLC